MRGRMTRLEGGHGPSWIRPARAELMRSSSFAPGYIKGSMELTAEFYRSLVANQSAVKLETSVPSLHSIPTVADGTPCGTEGNYTRESPHGLEACGYVRATPSLQRRPCPC